MTQITQSYAEQVLFEFPLNERFRTFLRIENLYLRWQHYLASESKEDHHTALLTLLDLYDFTFRNDVKGDLISELQRYKTALGGYAGAPEIAEDRLNHILLRLTDAQKQIEQSSKFGSNLVENEWLINVKNRLVVASGVCSFDMGFYYQWLQHSVSRRLNDLNSWMMPFNTLFDSVNLLLEIARNMAFEKECVTTNLVYQQPLFNRKFDLLRLEMPLHAPYLPDVSANKHVIWLRFALPTVSPRGPRREPNAQHVVVDELEFSLGLCGAPGPNIVREQQRQYGTLR